MTENHQCTWREGATRGVWKSSCSCGPFLDNEPQTDHCPYCGGSLCIVPREENDDLPLAQEADAEDDGCCIHGVGFDETCERCDEDDDGLDELTR